MFAYTCLSRSSLFVTCYNPKQSSDFSLYTEKLKSVQMFMTPKLEADEMIEFEQIVAASWMDDGPRRVKPYMSNILRHIFGAQKLGIS